jgi:hypothetical protein
MAGSVTSGPLTTVAAIVFGVVLGEISACSRPHGKAWQREAVLKGHAMWAVGKDGDPVFSWKGEVKP